jgi:hypothetical protein
MSTVEAVRPKTAFLAAAGLALILLGSNLVSDAVDDIPPPVLMAAAPKEKAAATPAATAAEMPKTACPTTGTTAAATSKIGFNTLPKGRSFLDTKKTFKSEHRPHQAATVML